MKCASILAWRCDSMKAPEPSRSLSGSWRRMRVFIESDLIGVQVGVALGWAPRFIPMFSKNVVKRILAIAGRFLFKLKFPSAIGRPVLPAAWMVVSNARVVNGLLRNLNR